MKLVDLCDEEMCNKICFFVIGVVMGFDLFVWLFELVIFGEMICLFVVDWIKVVVC